MTDLALKPIGPVYLLARVRRARCQVKGCTEKTRLALALPLADIGENGERGLGGVRICSGHLEEKVVVISDEERRMNR